MSLLALDVGNTRLKWGLHDGARWIAKGFLATADAAAGRGLDALPANAASRILASNVAGEAAAAALGALSAPARPVEFIRSRDAQCGVVSRYQPPGMLGTDRWAALIAAHAAMPRVAGPQLVVMAGTALTVDCLTADGVFLGGLIVPGLTLMRQSLNRGTAALPDLSGHYRTFPQCTRDAIAAGAIEACAGAVQRAYTHLAAETGATPQCIASGGAIEAIAPHLPFPVTINDNLVLDGLVAIDAADRPGS